MVYSEIRQAEKLIHATDRTTVAEIPLETLYNNPELIESVTDTANNLGAELEREALKESLEMLAEGNTWKDVPMSRNQLATERKKLLYFLSTAVLLGKNKQDYSNVACLNRSIGRLKDTPLSYLALIAGKDDLANLGTVPAIEPAKPKTVRQRIARSAGKFGPLLDEAKVAESEFHAIRRHTRRLSQVSTLAVVIAGQAGLTRDTVVLYNLAKKMGQEHGTAVIGEGADSIEPSDELRALIAEVPRR